MSGNPDIDFRPVTAADYPMLRRWFDSAHIRHWWGEAETALGNIKAMVEGRDTTRPHIFDVDGEPAGYIQSWSVCDEIEGGHAAEAPWLLDLPRDAAGVDLFIRDESMLSKGIGTAVLRAFLGRLFEEGSQIVVIDPDASNSRAVRAYEKAGFVAYDRFRDEKGVTLLMRITPERFAETTT